MTMNDFTITWFDSIAEARSAADALVLTTTVPQVWLIIESPTRAAVTTDEWIARSHWKNGYRSEHVTRDTLRQASRRRP